MLAGVWAAALAAGFANGPFMIYATGGLAAARVENADTILLPGSANSFSEAQTRWGWTAGAGVEWMFAPSWSAKVEYLYVDLGTASFTSVNTVVPAGTFQHDHRLTEQLVRVGVNYHFNLWGPVVARY